MRETLYLSVHSAAHVSTRNPIPAGKVATVNVKGVVGVWMGWRHGIDGAYCYDAPRGSAYYPANPPRRALHIQTNYGHFNPQPEVYNPRHNYTCQFIGNGSRLSFWFNDYHYPDNSGRFSIVVTW